MLRQALRRVRPVGALGGPGGRHIHENAVWQALLAVKHPDKGKNVLELKMVDSVEVKDDGKTVKVALDLDEKWSDIKKLIEQKIKSGYPEVEKVRVGMSPNKADLKPEETNQSAQVSGLHKVKHIIAVASCKGGVGKSTTAVNLAYTLKNLGFAVGIYDADIYGPSLPTMVSPADTALYKSPNNFIQPVMYEGAPLMSFGWTKPAGDDSSQGSGVAAMRGPMVSNVTQELISWTDWGELDYLLIDMPPGTGDIHLTLSQHVKIDAAVVVTTPQKLSFVDVVKGIALFDTVKIPTIAVVENMTNFICTHCGEANYPFGKGFREQIMEAYGIENCVQIPVEEKIAYGSDNGRPIVLEEKGNRVIKSHYIELAGAIVDEMRKVERGYTPPKVSAEYSGDGSIVVVRTDAGEAWTVPSRYLRYECGSADNKDERTNEHLVPWEKIAENVAPTSITPVGNYAVEIKWTDNHRSLFPYDTVIELAMTGRTQPP